MKLPVTLYEYEAEVSRVVDGDTVYLTLTKEFSLEVDFGFNIKDTVILRKTARIDFRLLGINTPEVHGSAATTGGGDRQWTSSSGRLVDTGPLPL